MKIVHVALRVSEQELQRNLDFASECGFELVSVVPWADVDGKCFWLFFKRAEPQVQMIAGEIHFTPEMEESSDGKNQAPRQGSGRGGKRR